MARPSSLPEWDTTQVNSIEPDATHKSQGWLAPGGVPEKPPFQTFNHWQNEVYRWIEFYDSTITKTYYLSEYSDLTAALSDIGSERAKLWIDINSTLIANVTLPNTLLVKVLNGNAIDLDAYDLNCNKTIFLGSPGCFVYSGLGVVTGLLYSEPEWWNILAGDGSTECSAAANAAIAALNAGGEIIFNIGKTYIINTGTVSGKGNVKYHGGGTLKVYPRDYTGLPDANVYPIIHFPNGEDNITVQNLLFDGDSTTQTNRPRYADDTTGLDALYFGACDNVRIERCEFNDFRGLAWNMTSDLKYNWFTNFNKISECEDGFLDMRYVENFEVIGNICDDAGVLPLVSEDPPLQGNGFLIGSCGYGRVTNNILKNMSRKGIYFTAGSVGACHDIVSENNYIEASYWTGVDISSGCLRVKSINDTVRNVGADGDGITITGIVSKLSVDCQIIEPDIENVGLHGIQFTFCTNPIIRGGKIRDTGLTGAAEDNSTDVIIDNVDIEGSGLENIKPESDYTIIKNCNLYNAGSHVINIIGNHTKIINNVIDGSNTNRGINISSGEDIKIHGNEILNTDIAIVLPSSGTLGIPQIINNIIDTCATRAISWAGTTNLTELVLQSNTYINPTAILSANLNNNNYAPVYYFGPQGQRITTTTSAAPTNGTWSAGDISYDISPTASGKIGWVCVVGGTPGTWKPFGAIDA